ncbi:MAG TPA: hypothetical protein VN416_08010 [Desulfomonilia bacterium]|nr:hypothetical protein [Desulfomonilia bacterium]
MKRSDQSIVFIIITAVFLAVAASSFLWAASEPKEQQNKILPDAPIGPMDDSGNTDLRMNRIDFGNTYIIGQSIKSGAVYLLQRKKNEIKSMLEYRDDYREEILDGFMVDGKEDAGKIQAERLDHEKPVSMKGTPDFAGMGSGH